MGVGVGGRVKEGLKGWLRDWVRKAMDKRLGADVPVVLLPSGALW